MVVPLLGVRSHRFRKGLTLEPVQGRPRSQRSIHPSCTVLSDGTTVDPDEVTNRTPNPFYPNLVTDGLRRQMRRGSGGRGFGERPW